MNILGDKRKAVTAEDLIRRYDLDKLKSDRKAITTLNDGLTKTNTNLENYVTAVTKDIKDLQDQVDGNITTWFYNGIPTLDNEPAINWATEEEKINHLGDLYYDQDTGYAYRWAMIDNKFEWNKIIDADVVEALALANAAQDTADQKRRTFFNEPTTPYDSGDIWIYQGEIYRCIRSRSDGEWNTADWVNDLIYTDDTLANKALTDLENFAQEVRDEYVTNKIFEETSNSLSSTIESVQIEVGKKNTVFREQPTTPYIIGDTWIQNEKVYVCKNPRAEGDFVESDWGLNLDGGKFATKTQIEQTDNKVSILANQVSDIEVELTTSKTASGNPIEITDAGPYPLKSIEIEGKSYQETTTASANKLDLDKIQSGFVNASTGVIETNDSYPDAVYSDFIFVPSGSTAYLIPNTDYTRFRIYNADKTYNKGHSDYAKYTADVDSYVRILWLYGIAEDTRPMVKIDDSSTDYVEFVSNSPSPEYPSEIKTVQDITNICPTDWLMWASGHYNTSGNKESHQYRCRLKDLIPVQPNEKYYVDTFKNDNYSHSFVLRTYKKDKTFNRSLGAIANEGTFTTTADDYYLGVTIYHAENKITDYEPLFNDGTIKPFICLNSESDKSFVPYGRWLKQISITKNKLYLVNSSGTKDGINYVWEGTKVTLNGTATAQTDIYNFGSWGSTVQNKDRLLKVGTYTLSIQGASNIDRFSIGAYYGTVSTIGVRRALTSETKKLTEDTYYSNFYLSIPSGRTFNNETFYFQLEEGDSVNEYQEPKENTALIDLNKENLFDSELELGSISNIDGSNVDSSSVIRTINYLQVKSSIPYSIILPQGSYITIHEYSEDYSYITNSVVNNLSTFTTSATTKYIRFRTSSGITDLTLKYKIYEGIGIDDYYEFASIDNTKDTFKDGVLLQRIAKVVLDGTQSLVYSEASNGRYDFIISNAKALGWCISDKYKYKYATENGCCFLSSAGNRVCIVNTTITTDAGIKEELTNNPVTIYYELAEPIEHQLNYEVLELHQGYNYITLNDELEPNMNIEYLTDVKQNALYATKGELLIESNTIKQSVTAEIEGLDKKVEGELELKVNLVELIAEINARADLIQLISDKLVIQSAKFKLSEGVMQAMGGTIGSVEIGENYLRIPITVEYDFTQDDIDKVYTYVRGTGTLTDEEFIKYDLNKDGIVNVYDVSAITQVVKTGITTSSPGHFVIEVNKDMPLYSGLYITDGYGAKKISFNFNGINVNGIDIESSITELYNRFGLLGLCTKLESGINDSGYFYIRGTIADGTQYQLNCTPTDLRFQKYENGAWTNIWTK